MGKGFTHRMCTHKMCTHKLCVRKALVVLAFAVYLCTAGYMGGTAEAYGETIHEEESSEVHGGTIRREESSEAHGVMVHVDGTKTGAADTKEEPVTQMTEDMTRMTDLTQAFDVILKGATKEFIAGYVIDETFLIWLDAQYGDDVIIDLAYCVLDKDMDPGVWYEKTGNSLHVLWLRFCQDSGFQNYRLNNVYWQDTADEEQAVLSFTGDFNFAEGWYTTEYMEAQPNGIFDCFSKELLEEMQASDVLLMNNEFAYAAEGRGNALAGKAYTFRARPEMVELLSVFGADAVTLANNHVYDYGETGLLDTMDCLRGAGMPYLGAGRNLEEATRILYYVLNGRKVAIVSATQIERTKQYTREATETECGVFKMLNPEKFLQVIEEAEANSDYVIAVVHWGTEGNLMPEASQQMLARKLADAGVDAIIGGHPHRLQGVCYVENVPVAYSLGNFWFSNGTLYTTLAQIIIDEDGALQMRLLPCIQEDMVTSLITDETEKEGFYHYLAAISMDVGIDTEGNVYDKGAEDYPAGAIAYDSDTSTTEIRGVADNEGNAIDIVGNLK